MEEKKGNEKVTILQYIYVKCPEEGCFQTAVIEYNRVQESTSGPITVSKVRCVENHWFILPRSELERS